MTDEGTASGAANSSKLIILDIDKNPITLDDNPAHIEGVLHQVALFFKRTKRYAALFSQGAKVLPSGKLSRDFS